MKPQAFAALCLLVLVASEMAVTTNAQCSVIKLLPCLEASQNAQVKPSDQCCSNIKTLGAGKAGADCLCGLLDNPLVIQRGAVFSIAITIPARCKAEVPPNYKCKGTIVPPH